MALIRLAYAADLPSPEDALRKLAESGGRSRVAPPRRASPAAARARAAAARARAARAAPPAPVAGAPARALAPFEDVVALARAKRDMQLLHALEHDVRLSRFEPGRIEFSLVEGASPALAQTLSRKLAEWTGERWMVALAAGRDRADAARSRASARGRAARAASRRIRWCAR